MSSKIETASDSDASVESTETNPVLEQARGDCEQAIEYGFEQSDPVLIDALPAMGKSSGVIRWAKATERPLTVLTERHDLYDQYIDWCNEHGLSGQRLPSFHHDCPTMDKESPEEGLRAEMGDLYRAGISGKAMHAHSTEYFRMALPCQQSGECPHIANLDFDPEAFDVLVGHYQHARVNRYINARYVVFDEFPGDSLLDTFSSDVIAPAVTQFLKDNEGLPFGDYTELIEYRHKPADQHQGREWFRNHRPALTRDVEAVEEHGPTAHTMGPLLAYAILISDDLGNGWEYSNLGSGRVSARNRATGTLTLLQQPDLSDASSVLTLDGTPTTEKWELLLGKQLEHYPVLDRKRRQEYIKNGLSLSIIQTTDELKPYNSGKWVTVPSDRLLFEAIRQREGRKASLISSKRAIAQYDHADALADIERTQHYGNLKGSNGFECVRLGIVAGSAENGSDEIERWGALAGRPIESNGGKGMERAYGEYGNAILHGMRENEVLQAVMRFGRKEQNGERGATVYVHTAALPDWVPVSGTSVDIRSWESDVGGMKQVLDAIEDMAEWRTSDVANCPGVTVSQRQVCRNLKKLREYGYIDGENEGPGIGYYWQDIRSAEASSRGHVGFH